MFFSIELNNTLQASGFGSPLYCSFRRVHYIEAASLNDAASLRFGVFNEQRDNSNKQQALII